MNTVERKDAAERTRRPMKKEAKDLLWVLVIGLVVMFALPIAYRVWVHYNPPPPRKPISEVLHDAGGVRREMLLNTPTDKWNESDKSLAPDIRDWLAAHADVILPWEWSDEARKKDWKGYCDSWRRILEEQSARLEKLISRKTDDMEEAAKMAGKERKIAADGMAGATNALASAEAHERERDEAKAAVDELTKAKDGVASSLGEIAAAQSRGYAAGGVAKGVVQSLIESIAVVYRYRADEKRRLPKWLPDRVRKWLSAHGGAMPALGEA